MAKMCTLSELRTQFGALGWASTKQCPTKYQAVSQSSNRIKVSSSYADNQLFPLSAASLAQSNYTIKLRIIPTPSGEYTAWKCLVTILDNSTGAYIMTNTWLYDSTSSSSYPSFTATPGQQLTISFSNIQALYRGDYVQINPTGTVTYPGGSASIKAYNAQAIITPTSSGTVAISFNYGNSGGITPIDPSLPLDPIPRN